MAADEIGLTGLWLLGRNTLPTYFRMNILCGKHRFLQSPKDGWMCIFPAKNRILHRLFIRSDLHSDRKCGRFCCRFRMVRQRHMERLPDNWLKSMAWIICLHRAVGGAVGHNEVSIIIPCHRVVGANGSLTGYAGGIDKKVRLLELEKTDMTKFFIPKRGTAL